MGTLGRPTLASGALKEFNDALHELHWQAHRPTVREMSTAISGTVVASHGRIHDAFTKPRLPDWELTRALVAELASRAPDHDPDAGIQRFHRLSLAASDPSPVVSETRHPSDVSGPDATPADHFPGAEQESEATPKPLVSPVPPAARDSGPARDPSESTVPGSAVTGSTVNGVVVPDSVQVVADAIPADATPRTDGAPRADGAATLAATVRSEPAQADQTGLVTAGAVLAVVPAGRLRSVRDRLAALHIWPADSSAQLAVLSLALQWLGLGLAIGLGRGLADEFSGPLSYALLAVGMLVGFASRRYFLPVGLALTALLLVVTWVDDRIVSEAMDKVTSGLGGVLVGMAVWWLVGVVRRSVNRLTGRGIGNTWLGVLMASFLAIGFLITTAMGAGTGGLGSSAIWTVIAGGYIAVGVLLANRRENQP